MFDISSKDEREKFKRLLKEHFEAALKDSGLESITVITQVGRSFEEGFDVILEPPVAPDIVRGIGDSLVEKFKLTGREWAYYFNDAEQKYDGMHIKGTAKDFLGRLNR